MAIRLNIYLPDRALPEETADKVVLPIKEGNLTIIDERAPSSQLLTRGTVQLLDSQNQITMRWFINGGIADIAENNCKIAIEQAVDLSKISIEEARQKASQSNFDRELYEYLKSFA